MRHDDGMLPTAFDHQMAAGRTAVLSGDHAVEGAPAETGRWASVVFLPNGPVAAALGRLTLEVMEILGEVRRAGRRGAGVGSWG